MIPVGISQSANYFVGKFIGEGCPKKARQFSDFINYICYAWAIISMVAVQFFAGPIQRFYNPKEGMITAMNQAWSTLLVFIFFDCTQAVANSNIQGLGLVAKV